jgi:hypothetical protein
MARKVMSSILLTFVDLGEMYDIVGALNSDSATGYDGINIKLVKFWSLGQFWLVCLMAA